MSLGMMRLPGISIHAPVRERLLRSAAKAERENFNSRSREGATVDGGRIVDVYINFNSRSREGATADIKQGMSAIVFQFTLP